MDRRSFVAGSIALACGTILGPRPARAAPSLSVEVTATGDVDQLDFAVAVGNAGELSASELTVELALDPDVYVDPARYYRLVDAVTAPMPTLAFRPGSDGLASSSRPRLTWIDPAPLAAGETRVYHATVAVANVHPHRYGMLATATAGDPPAVVATSEPVIHDRSLGALFGAAAQRLAEGRPERSWGPYHLLPLRGGAVGLSSQPGWPSLLVAVDAGELGRVGTLRLDRSPAVGSDGEAPRVGTFYRAGTARGAVVALFADPARLESNSPVHELAARLVAARPDLLYHEPPHVVGVMLPGTRGARVGLSRDAGMSGFGATALLNVSAMVAAGALSPRRGDPLSPTVRIERAEGAWWLTLTIALDEGVG